MSSGPTSRASRRRDARLAFARDAPRLWYVTVTLGSFLALAAILPLGMHVWTEQRGAEVGRRVCSTGTSDALELGGTDALRAMFACDAGPTPSVAIRLRDEQHIEIYRRVLGRRVQSRGDCARRRGRGSCRAEERRPRGGTSLPSRCPRGDGSSSSLHDDAAPRLWSRAREASLLILGCGLASAILGAFVITRRALRPVGDLARATQDILASGDLALRVRTRGTADDLDQLAALFNRMLGRNEALVRAMKESLDNVAHDLRTPLARLRAGAELALREPPDRCAVLAKPLPRPSRSRTASSGC